MAIKLILLDRDGVINVDRPDSVKSPEELEFIPGSLESIAKLNKMNFKVAIVTNQAVVGRGTITLGDLSAIHGRLHRELASHNARIDEIFYCIDAMPSPRRKPAPGMLLEAMEKFQINPQETLFIGDDLRDMEAAQAAGCYKVLVRTGKGAQNEKLGFPDHVGEYTVFDSLKDVVDALAQDAS
jgi:D-glycero-D-manno-heptose 1,7-bisphosphate phosphatase